MVAGHPHCLSARLSGGREEWSPCGQKHLRLSFSLGRVQGLWPWPLGSLFPQEGIGRAILARPTAALGSGGRRRPRGRRGQMAHLGAALGPWPRTFRLSIKVSGIRDLGGRAPWPSLPPRSLPDRSRAGPGPMAQDPSVIGFKIKSGPTSQRFAPPHSLPLPLSSPSLLARDG